jgi:nucleoside-diphosphate-sugar epimerase
MDRTALVVGVTGIAGYNIAQSLLADGWRVVGLSRAPRYEIPGVEHVYADVHDQASVEAATAGRGITHLFFSTWSRQPTEAENCAVNGAMLGNTLQALARTATLRHAVLITGLKHYLGPFEAYAEAPADTPFREVQERLPFQNFYYEQEDILFTAAAEHGFTWSVHRPHTMIGYALGNAMNMGVTLAVYGSICRARGEQFIFPGSPQQWNGITDITDARLLGRHAVWSATEPAARNQAFNTTNGDVFRWRQMWPRLAEALGVEAAPYSGQADPLEARLAHADETWATLTDRYGLAPYRATGLASWWHTDADLGRPIEAFADMTKSRALGFQGFRRTDDTFRHTFAGLKAAKIVP